MTTVFDTQSSLPFEIRKPETQRAPFVLNSPHSGRIYPENFVATTQLGKLGIRKSEDFMVDDLVSSCVNHGIPLLAANFPRAYLDVNREPYELDPSMFDGVLPDYANTRSLRVSSGLGTIARIVAEGEEIYGSQLSVDVALQRIDEVYKPYHAALRQLLVQTHVRFGSAVLIDCHSMPSTNATAISENRPDFVLGDRYGSSCTPQLTHYAKEILQGMGYHVEINKPYAGGFITEHYGRPQNGLHALQIEINRSLYMDEVRIAPSKDFKLLSGEMEQFISAIADFPVEELSGSKPLAAE